MPDRWIDGLKAVEEGGETKYRVSLDYPEIMPFMDNADAEPLRRELFLKNQVKGGRPNIGVLEEALRVRTEIADAARLRRDWMAYVTEKRMAKNARGRGPLPRRPRAEAARQGEARPRDPLAREGRAHRRSRRSTSGTGGTTPTGCSSPSTRSTTSRSRTTSRFSAMLDGMFADHAGAARHPLSARARRAEVARRMCRPSTSSMPAEVEPFARFYMDLYPRPNKFNHAAAFTLRSGRELPDGSYQQPISAIVANFTKPTADAPSLLRHKEVETLFHEFGHILHQTLTRARFLDFSGSSTERDFVEAPSQMLEHWVWDRDVLHRFARHHETGETLPDAMLDAMIRAKNVSSGLRELRQMFFARLDYTLHSAGLRRRLHRGGRAPLPDHVIPVPGRHVHAGGVRPSVRVRRRVLRLPLVACLRRRHVHPLRDRRPARRGDRARVPAQDPRARRYRRRR